MSGEATGLGTKGVRAAPRHGAHPAPGTPRGLAEGHLSGLILDHARDGIALLDMRGRLLWMNPALERMLGWTLDEARGRNPAELISPPGAGPTPEALARFRYDPASSLFAKYRVTRHMRRDGTLFWNQQSHALIDLGPAETQKMVVVTCRDISDEVEVQTALRSAKDDLEHAAHHDDLTGLGNRKKLSRFLRSAPARASLRGARMGVLQLDLDRFKQINDTLGHDAGDAVLRHVAGALSRSIEAGDLACRMGGDEFVLICTDVPDRARLVRRAEDVLAQAARPLHWRGQTILPGVSIGASMPGGDRDAETGEALDGEALIRQADLALYSAKAAGRGRAALYSPALGRRHRAEQALARDLKDAVEEGQFCVHLQPIAEVETGRITGCEALLRWAHPARGLLPPASFLPAADSAQLLSEIDYLAMNAALDALAELRAAGFADLTMSLNVSTSILVDADYPALLDWALQTRGLPSAAVCIEVLETTMQNRAGHDVTGAMTRLRALGMRVALDDFGTGYAGFAHMSAVEIDAIKLDRTMIRRLGQDPRARVITRALIRLCGVLGMDVIASGVETEEQLGILRRAGCPQVQGYGLARPMALPDLAEWLRAHSPGPLVLRAEPQHGESAARAPHRKAAGAPRDTSD
ncbi:putative bifunctional diguanylate cyclase/phosphodiesterase [Roseovarius aquimarinus]|uniref:Bifunctional diguanylate cyclase/phosphodiesterase n=1 Tax=Roseovarius aquimarinus TaxID=1229156 RepID=A0ABW7I8R9_9RHOB